jgi:catechol 2,3-dioxygenase-like lactoylglutathione lyase family enzyme
MDRPDPNALRLFSIELRTRDWERLLGWYRDGLGMAVVVRSPEDRFALLAAGPTLLALLGRPSTDPPSGRWSLAFEADDLAALRTRLAERPDAPTPLPGICRHAEGYDELVVDDPDGNRVRLFAWPPEGDE